MSTALRIAMGLLGVLLVCVTQGAAVEAGFRPEMSVVLKDAAGLDLIGNCTPMAFPTKQWNPSLTDIQMAESALAPALKTGLRAMKDASDVSDYYRQYAGGFYEGAHILYVRGFHRSYLESLASASERDAWKSHAVHDGLGHTRFWCAYWVKETKSLIKTSSMGDLALGVGFRGTPSPCLGRPVPAGIKCF